MENQQHVHNIVNQNMVGRWYVKFHIDSQLSKIINKCGGIRRDWSSEYSGNLGVRERDISNSCFNYLCFQPL